MANTSVPGGSAEAAAVAGRVSIVLPVYNGEETVAAAVESCLAQTYEDVEIIVVNDGSTDRTRQVLDGFGNRVRVLSQGNGGLAAARNAGTRAATGEYVAWMDGDDLAAPERLSTEVSVLASMPEIALVSSDFSAFVTVDADFDSSHISAYYHAASRLGGLAEIYSHHGVIVAAEGFTQSAATVRWGRVYERLLWGNFVHPPTVMVRRGVFDEAGFFDEALRYSSDYDLIIRIARGGPLAFVDAPLLRYRISPSQMSHAAAGGRVPLETVKVLDKVRRTDPAVFAEHPALFKQRFAESFVSASEMIGPSDRRRALALLVRAARFKLLFSRSLRALAKIVLPRMAITAARRIQRLASYRVEKQTPA